MGLTDAAAWLFRTAVAVAGGCHGVNPMNKLHPLCRRWVPRGKQRPVKMPHKQEVFQVKVTDLPAPTASSLLFPGRFHTPQPCHVLVTGLTLPQPTCLPLGVSAAPTAGSALALPSDPPWDTGQQHKGGGGSASGGMEAVRRLVSDMFGHCYSHLEGACP